MDATQSKSNEFTDAAFNAFAASQVAELEAPATEDNYRLARRLPLAGRASLETMERAVWETYGLKHSVRFWVWLSVLFAVAVYGLFAGWSWWWPAILLGVVAVLLFFAVYLPSRLVRHVRRSAEPVDRLCRGAVSDEALEYESQTPEGQWVASMSGDTVVPWAELRLLKLGGDYLFFLRRKEHERWVFSLPRQLFHDDRDWHEMVEFAERKLAHTLVAPRCGKCKRRLARSELRTMPWVLRLVGQPLCILFGVPAAGYCSGCWAAAYMRELTFAIAVFVVMFWGLVAAIAYLVL